MACALRFRCLLIQLKKLSMMSRRRNQAATSFLGPETCESAVVWAMHLAGPCLKVASALQAPLSSWLFSFIFQHVLKSLTGDHVGKRKPSIMHYRLTIALPSSVAAVAPAQPTCSMSARQVNAC